MTISTTTSRISYNGNGVTTVFSFPYRFLANGDLVVLSVSAAGVETTKALTTDYTLTGAGDDAGGSVTMLVAPAVGTRLIIYRDTAITQETDYISGDPFPAETHEQALDRLTMIAQEIGSDADRAIKVPVGDSSGLSTTLPAAANRLDKFIVFDATTGEVEVSTITMTQVASAIAAAYSAGGSTADAVIFIQSGTGAVSRTAQEKMRDVFCLADHGAVGDGSTDDGAAIARTIAAAPAGSRIIGAPGAVYNIATAVTVNKALTFDEIDFEAGANVAMFTLTADRIAFKGCGFDLLAGSTTASKAIYAQARDGITIQGCRFSNGYYGAYLEECTRTLIRGNRCSDSLHWHIFVDGGNYIAITDNICRGGAYDGIKIASATTGTGVQRDIANLVISNNVCEGNSSDGIDCAVNDAENVVIANNVLTNNGLTAIEFKTVKHADTALTYGARNILIAGNVCRNGPDTDNATTLISVQSGDADYAARSLGSQLVEDVTIRGNKCYLQAVGANNGFSIRVVDATKAVVKGNDIIYKMTGTSATGQIRIHYGLDTVVRENDIDCTGVAMTCVSVSSFGTANPTAGVVITENTCRTGAGGNPIVIPDAAVSGTEIYENRIYPDAGQYTISDSGTGTVYTANYRGTTTGAPTARGRPGDYFVEATQTAGYPERWTCVAQGAPGTWQGMNQRGFRTNAGSPAGSVTPTHAGEMLYDSSGSDWYKASGATNASWTQLTN